MTASTYGSFELPVEEPKQRSKWIRVAALVGVLGAMGLIAMVLSAEAHQRMASDVAKQVKEIPDCQCQGTCNTPNKAHKGNWCYIDPTISPCMDSTKRTIYGQSWARCTVIYGDDDCAGNPCKNQAYCVDKYDGFKCECRNGWSGKDCSTQVLVEYTVHIATASGKDDWTKNAIFVTFTGTEGDVSKEHALSLKGIGAFERSQTACPNLSKTNKGYLAVTVTAQDVGELHKISYRVGGDDSFKPALVRVEYKGTMYAAVGKLAASESQTPKAVTLVKARKYSLNIKSIDSPNWAASKDDVSVQLTGKNWQVTGEVVALPSGIEDGLECNIDFYGADVGTPAKVTYWISGKDTFFPTKIMVDKRWQAQITAGDRCYTDSAGKFLFGGDTDTGRGYAYKVGASCPAGKTSDGCTGVKDCRKCALWDPVAAKDEVLCPWALPFTDGRYIIVDLVDKNPPGGPCTIDATPVIAANGGAIPVGCTKGKVLKDKESCALVCASAAHVPVGKQPGCFGSKFDKGTIECKVAKPCTLTATPAVTANGAAIPGTCVKGQVVKDGDSCALTCNANYKVVGTQPKCSQGVFSAGTVKCEKMIPCVLTAADVPAVPAGGAAIPAACTATKTIADGGKCALTCNANHFLSGDQPSCLAGKFNKGSIKCTAAKPCTIAADPVIAANGAAIPAACKATKVLADRASCTLACNANFILTGTQPKCNAGVFDKGTVACRAPKTCTIAADPPIPGGAANGAAIPAPCKAGQTLAHNAACTLTCLAGKSGTGNQPKCVDGVFDKGTYTCA